MAPGGRVRENVVGRMLASAAAAQGSYTADSSLNVPVLSPMRSTGTPSLFSSVRYRFASGVPAG